MFAAAAQRSGVREMAVELPGGATVGDALGAVRERHPALGEFDGRLATAINAAYVPQTFLLSEGDELALIPPVSGG